MEKEFVNYELTKKLNDLGIEVENIYGKFLQFTMKRKESQRVSTVG